MGRLLVGRLPVGLELGLRLAPVAISVSGSGIRVQLFTVVVKGGHVHVHDPEIELGKTGDVMTAAVRGAGVTVGTVAIAAAGRAPGHGGTLDHDLPLPPPREQPPQCPPDLEFRHPDNIVSTYVRACVSTYVCDMMIPFPRPLSRRRCLLCSSLVLMPDGLVQKLW